MANDAIQSPIIKCQALCFWFLVICCFLLPSLFEEICTGNPGSKYKKAELSFSMYLKNMNAMALAVDNCWFLSNNLVLLNSMLVTYTRNPKKHQPSSEIHILFQSKYSCCCGKQIYLGYVSQIYYPSHKRTIFHIVVCLFFYFFPKICDLCLLRKKVSLSDLNAVCL